MPRNYVKKRPQPSYTVEDVKNAALDVENKNKTYREAELYYGVPKAVIFNRFHGRKTSLEKIGAGRPQFISKEIEDEICQCVIKRSEMGLPCDKDELKRLVGQYLQSIDSSLTMSFRDGIPGEDWYIGFMKRHPNISLKKPELLQKLRKDARKPKVVYDFYDKLEKLVREHDLIDKPSFVFNADESGFHHDPGRVRGLGVKGKSLSRISGGSGRESTTVLACVSANGASLPPLIIFKGAAVQCRWTSSDALPGTLYAASTNGWMEEPQFYHWFLNGFVPYIESLRRKMDLESQTALLVYDGHCSHISVRIVEQAIKNNIHLMRLPSHLTDKIQPLDKCVFGPIKTAWEKKLVQYGKEQMGRGSMRLSKCIFSKLIGEIWKESLIQDNIISGFKSTGIYPVDRTMFPIDEFDPIDLEIYQQLSLEPPETASAVNNQLPTMNNESNVEVDSTNILTNMNQTALQEGPLISIENQVRAHPSLADLFDTTASIKQKSSEFPIQKKQPIPRLKQMTYGEVLTTDEVLDRLKNAEDKKRAQKRKKEDKSKTLNKAKKMLKEKNDSSTSSEDAEIPLQNDDDSPWDEKENELEEEELQYVDVKKLEKGCFILARFKGGKRNSTIFKYVCVVESFNSDDNIEVTGLKSLDTAKITFVLVPSDKCTISISHIVGILPPAKLQKVGKRTYYKFNKKVDVNEK